MHLRHLIVLIIDARYQMTPLEKITRLWTRTNDPHLARCGSVLIGQIKKEPEFTCICCLSPWVGIKQAAMHLFTMSKDPAIDTPGISNGNSRKVSRQPNLLSDLRRTIFGKWWSRTESNRRHPACKAGALPTELRPLPGNRKVGRPGWTRTTDLTLSRRAL
jgi:hypothetical protein